MGVTHKLSKEVINSIIKQKIDVPDISCRQLASLISNKYQIHISKSSINSVLKNAQLSSSVGRRPSTLQKESFHIPQQTKLSLKKNMAELGFGNLIEEEEKSSESQDPKIFLLPDPLEKSEALASSALSEGQSSALQEGNELLDQPSAAQDFIEKVNKIRLRQEANKGPLYEGMGCIFLKAAEWELANASILGGLFRKYVQVTRPDNFEDMIEGLLYLHFLDVQSFDDSREYFQHALWDISARSKLYHPSYLKILFEKLQAEKLTKQILFEYRHQTQQVLSEVSGYALYLEDDTELKMDAHLTALGRPLSPKAWPINKAMSMLSHQIISNNQS